MRNQTITLVLLPGMHGTETLFNSFISVKPDGFSVKTVNYPTNSTRSYQQLQSELDEEIKRIETPFLLLGESFSGPLALLLADSRPRNLIGVLLVGTFVIAPSVAVARILPWTLIFYLAKLIFKPLVLLRRMYPGSILLLAMVEVRKNRSSIIDRSPKVFIQNRCMR